MKRVLLLFVVIAILGVAGFFAWNVTAGPLKAKAQFREFTEAMTACEPLDQSVSAMMRGRTLTRSVLGKEGETCRIEMQSLAPYPEFVVCDLELEKMPTYAESYLRQNDNIGIFGITRVQISTSTEDPFTVALNSPACKIERR